MGGAPPPSVLKDGKPSSALSKYVIALLYPWTTCGTLPFSPTPKNLLRVCREWNSTHVTFINRQRYRTMEHLFQKHYRSSKNEKTCSEWRSRNADMWQQMSPPQPAEPSTDPQKQGPDSSDPEAAGLLSVEDRELYDLTSAASAKHRGTINAVRTMRATFWSVIPDCNNARCRTISTEPIVFQDHLINNFQLAKIARKIHALVPPAKHNNEHELSPLQRHDGVVDPLGGQSIDQAHRRQCSPDQLRVFDTVIGSIETDGTLRQTLTVLHGGGGTGKSSPIHRITDSLASRGIETVSTCPTGVGASLLENGKTVHSAFKVFKQAELNSNDLELMRLTFTTQVWLVVVDEVSMLSAEQLDLLNMRLRKVYGNNLDFGGRSMMLAGDFLQLDVTCGTALCAMMYRSSAPKFADARALFRKFTVHFLTQQHRAAGCEVHKANLAECRALPPFYPSGTHYTASEKRAFRPFASKIADTVTHQLTLDEITRDPDWLDEMTILVTNNLDKAVLTACAARLFARRHGELLFRWRRRTKVELPPELQRLVYDEDSQPELFAYFVRGIPAQILDNNNGNVSWSIANGSPCKMHSLAWDDQAKTDLVVGMVRRARQSRAQEIDLPFPPDFINVVLSDPAGESRARVSWPNELNLSSDRTDNSQNQCVVIPIGLMGPRTRGRNVSLGAGILEKPLSLPFVQHAVDISLVMTVWKAQGSTLKRVILNLESIRDTAPKWEFEHLYVGMSRVTAARFLRCFPLTGAFRMSKIQDLRPNINTTKWRLDHQTDSEVPKHKV